MNGRTFCLLGVLVVASLWTAGCSDDNAPSNPASSSPEATETSAVLSLHPTGMEGVDGVIDAALSGDFDALRQLVKYSRVPCMTFTLHGTPCRPGEADGTMVDAFLLDIVLGMYVRADTAEGFLQHLATESLSLHAVYRLPSSLVPPEIDASLGPCYLALFSLPNSETGAGGIELMVIDGRLVSARVLDWPLAETPQMEGLTDVVLAPGNVFRGEALGIQFRYPDSWVDGATPMPYASCFGCRAVGPASSTYPYGVMVFVEGLALGVPVSGYVGNNALPQGEQRTLIVGGQRAGQVEIERNAPLGLAYQTGDYTPYRETWTLVPVGGQALFVVAFYRYGDEAAKAETESAYEQILASFSVLKAP